MSNTSVSVQTFYPCIRYADAQAAIDWLVRAFGFRVAAHYPHPDGGVAHAELRFGDGLFMLGTTLPGDAPNVPPSADGKAAASIYVAVPANEIDAHYERAKAAGARIYREIHDTDYGSRDYSALDPEGHLWSFGTYRP